MAVRLRVVAQVLHGRAGMSCPRVRVIQLRQALLTGALSDHSFDQLFAGAVRARSKQYWTPLAVALRAAELFRAHGARRVFDVGCGPGKFCIAAAISQPALTLVGSERRTHLVDVADELAERFALSNARFVCGDAFDRSWRRFDGFYFFNPFWENIATDRGKFDQTVELSGSRFVREQVRVGAALRRLRLGTVLISYHGIGAPIPSSYELVANEPAGTDRLRVWQRKRETEEEWFYMESDDSAFRVSRRELEAVEGRHARRYAS